MYKQENDKLIRVTRKAAEKAYNEGKAIYLLPCKIRLDNMWIIPYRAQKNQFNGMPHRAFPTNFYNCTVGNTLRGVPFLFSCFVQQLKKSGK